MNRQEALVGIGVNISVSQGMEGISRKAQDEGMKVLIEAAYQLHDALLLALFEQCRLCPSHPFL